MQIDIQNAIGKNYNNFWTFKGRYRVIKGGRASKKSTNTAMWYIYHLLKHNKANLLCVRQVANTLRDSCWTELKKAAKRLKVYDRFTFIKSPLEITVKATGQKVLFRGMDNPDGLTSINVDEGVLCWLWIEEAFEINKEEEFDKLDECIRGLEIEQFGLYPQVTLTMNPWSVMWIKGRFFDRPRADTLALTRNWYHNEFLSKTDYMRFLDMKRDNPDRYYIAGEGNWGIPGGRYFIEFDTRVHVIKPIEIPHNWRKYRVFDYGLDMLAVLWIAVDTLGNVYVYRELCKTDSIITDSVNSIKELTNDNESIYLTYAPPDLWSRSQESGKSKADLFMQDGLHIVKSSNNRESGWLCIRELLKINGDGEARLKIFSSCTELIRCLPQLQYDKKKLTDCATEPHDITHITDALRYFAIQYILPAKPVDERTEVQKYKDKVIRQNKRKRGY